MRRLKDFWERWREFFLLVGPTWVVTILLAMGILLWSWPMVLLFVVPVFGFPAYGILLDWLRSGARRERRAERKAARLERRHHRAASAH